MALPMNGADAAGAVALAVAGAAGAAGASATGGAVAGDGLATVTAGGHTLRGGQAGAGSSLI